MKRCTGDSERALTLMAVGREKEDKAGRDQHDEGTKAYHCHVDH